MKIVEQRNDPVRLFWRRMRLAALIAACVFGMFTVTDVLHKERDSRQARVQAETALADLTARQDQLDKNIARLETDRGMEAAVREQYQMGKQGEGMVVIVDKEVPREEEATSTIGTFIHNVLPWW